MVRETWQFLSTPQVVAAVKNLNVSQTSAAPRAWRRLGEAGGIWVDDAVGVRRAGGGRVQRCVIFHGYCIAVVPRTQPNISSTASRSPATPVDVTVSPPDTVRSVP